MGCVGIFQCLDFFRLQAKSKRRNRVLKVVRLLPDGSLRAVDLDIFFGTHFVIIVEEEQCPETNSVSEPWASLLRNGFLILLAIGVIDSRTRIEFLTFLPFLLRAKGLGYRKLASH